MLINVIIMCGINFMLIRVEHEKSFMTSGPGYHTCSGCATNSVYIVLRFVRYVVIKYQIYGWYIQTPENNRNTRLQ